MFSFLAKAFRANITLDTSSYASHNVGINSFIAVITLSLRLGTCSPTAKFECFPLYRLLVTQSTVNC